MICGGGRIREGNLVHNLWGGRRRGRQLRAQFVDPHGWTNNVRAYLPATHEVQTNNIRCNEVDEYYVQVMMVMILNASKRSSKGNK